jgi:hypothetical protein
VALFKFCIKDFGGALESTLAVWIKKKLLKNPAHKVFVKKS